MKAVRVIQQVKLVNISKSGKTLTTYADVVERDDGFFSARVYKTSKAKTSGGVAYGIRREYKHDGEHISQGTEEAFSTIEDATAAFSRRVQTAAKVIQVKTVQLFNY